MYFPLLSLHGWGERLGEGRRHNCAVMPYNKYRISLLNCADNQEIVCQKEQTAQESSALPETQAELMQYARHAREGAPD